MAKGTEAVDLEGLLAERFGHEAFRPGQREAIEAVLGGRDVLLVLPTGAGKSLVYRLAAEVLPGFVIVVSPLIALMRDQVEAAGADGQLAERIDSTLGARRIEAALTGVEEGRVRLLYVTPERLEDADLVARLRDAGPALAVVDEAHVVSQWGHGFRPAYLELAGAIEALGRPPALAVTATANPWVRREVVERLGLRDPLVVARASDRPNLFLEAVRVERARDELAALARLLDGEPRGYGERLDAELAEAMTGSGIVYVQTTRAARETAAWLRRRGIAADYYHGGRRAADRERVQEAFMRGDVRVVAATNAFGLGIDKPDVRFVIHRQPPASVEEYHQEAGRAGRDGLPARCVLIHRPAALGRAAFLAGGGRLEREEVRRAREGLLRRREGTLAELGEATGLGRADLIRLVDLLVAGGVAERRRGRVRLVVDDFDPDAVPLEGEDRRRAYERSRLQMLRALAETGACRRRFILEYLGESPAWERCGNCDNDALGIEPTPLPELGGALEGGREATGLAAGDEVEHERFGPGVVQGTADGRVTVAFEDGAIRTLAAALVLGRGVLRGA